MMKRFLVLAVLLPWLGGCVNVDPETGKTIPRGKQKHEFATVEKLAERLQDGMTKPDVLMLLGSPAESRDKGRIWYYLPERSAALIPAQSLRLEFKDNVLVSHGSRAIVFGHPF